MKTLVLDIPKCNDCQLRIPIRKYAFFHLNQDFQLPVALKMVSRTSLSPVKCGPRTLAIIWPSCRPDRGVEKLRLVPTYIYISHSFLAVE